MCVSTVSFSLRAFTKYLPSQCGIIDVVPNATSREGMGRAKVNDLQDFFMVVKYGGQDTTSFQRARLNFINGSLFSRLLHLAN